MVVFIHVNLLSIRTVGLTTCGAAAGASNFPYETLIEKLCSEGTAPQRAADLEVSASFAALGCWVLKENSS